jgi:hypothetical protein
MTMNFRLVQHKSTRALTTFHVLNKAGDVVGSINVPPAEAKDLQKCWLGAHRDPAAKAGPPRVRLPAMSKAAILRGC